jgi:hypothetical protein
MHCQRQYFVAPVCLSGYPFFCCLPLASSFGEAASTPLSSFAILFQFLKLVSLSFLWFIVLFVASLSLSLSLSRHLGAPFCFPPVSRAPHNQLLHGAFGHHFLDVGTFPAAFF